MNCGMLKSATIVGGGHRSRTLVIRLTYLINTLKKRCYLNHFPSRGIFPLLIVVVDQISRIFKKL